MAFHQTSSEQCRLIRSLAITLHSFVPSLSHSFTLPSRNTHYVPGTGLNAMSSHKSEQDTYNHPLGTQSLVGSPLLEGGGQERWRRLSYLGGSQLRLPHGVFGKAEPGGQGHRCSWQRRGGRARPGEQMPAQGLRLGGAQEDERHKDNHVGGKGRGRGLCSLSAPITRPRDMPSPMPAPELIA